MTQAMTLIRVKPGCFLPPTQEGSVFDGSSKFCPFMVKQYEVTVSWQESNGVTPAPVSLLSLKANLEE